MTAALDGYDLSEMKQIYRVLHAALPSEPALLDSRLLEDVQTRLQREARLARVDVTDHRAWAQWLAR